MEAHQSQGESKYYFDYLTDFLHTLRIKCDRPQMHLSRNGHKMRAREIYR